MKQRITKVKKKTGSGFTTAIPIGAKAQDITLQNGTILQDVIDVLSTGQAGHMDLTQAQYNALSDQEKNNGTVYFVEDGTPSGSSTIASASAVSYNNTNVQSALDDISINKINYSDVVNDLTSNSISLPLSAAQGKELKDQIDSQDTRIDTLEGKTTTLEGKTITLEGKTANLSASDTATTISGTLNTGGTITANNTSGACDVRAWSSARRIALFATGDGLCGLYDNTNNNQILRSGTDQTVAIPHKFVTQPWGSTNVIPPVCTSMTTGYIVNWLQTGGDYLSVSAQWGGSSYGQRSISVPSGSDRRLKTNIKPTEKSGLDLINALDIVQFDWKDGSGHWDFGIIAQDAGKLDKNIPAGEETEDTYLTLNTMYLVDILLKATQQLSKKVDNLEQQVKELKENNK